jgi:UDP-N-acetylglucosamine 1-carboxyvinyltransferase
MRSIEAHVDVFQKVGVSIERLDDKVRFVAPKKVSKEYKVWQIEASVTATENLAMYAAGTGAQFQLVDAASEPHVTDLLKLLVDMGAKIEGIGSNRLSIVGTKKFTQADFLPRPDFIDITGTIVATAITNGKVRIKGANIPDMVDGIINWYQMFNIDIKKDGEDLIVSVGKGGLEVDVHKQGFPMAAPNLPKLYPRPWPGFPVDAIPPMAVLASKSRVDY